MLSYSRMQNSKKGPHLGLVENIDENEYPYNSWKKSEETNFRGEVGDKDLIARDKIIKLISAINYKINNWGHYILNYLATNLDMCELWLVLNKDWLGHSTTRKPRKS